MESDQGDGRWNSEIFKRSSSKPRYGNNLYMANV